MSHATLTERIEDGARVIRVRDSFTPNRKQMEFFAACAEPTAEEVMYDGSIRAGKTQAASKQIVAWAWKYGGVYVIARKTYPELRDSNIAIMLRGEGAMPPACPPALVEQWRASTYDLFLKNGAEIRFRNLESAEEGRAKLRNVSLNAMFIDQVEELDSEDWFELYEELCGRLSDPRGPGKMLLSANPGPTDHWAYKRFIDPDRDPSLEEHTRYVHCTLFDNQENLDPRYFASRIRTKDTNPEYYKRMVLGEWGAFGSKRFKLWDSKVHVISPFTIPKHWEVIESIDYGYSHHFVCLWIAIDEMERYYVIAEHAERERPVSWHAEQIKKVRDDLNLKPTVTWCDPSVYHKKNGMESISIEMADYGLYVSPADNDRLGGWNRIEEMLTHEIGGVRQLRVFNHCRKLIGEIPNLRFKENSDDVEKKNDHASDALRYAVMSRPPAPDAPTDEEADDDRRSLYAQRRLDEALNRNRSAEALYYG